MRRRRLFKAFGGTAALWALPAHAQRQTKVWTVGILVRAAPGWEEFWRVFPEAMGKLGYVEGKNIHYVLRTDEGDLNRLPALAAELVRLKVDVIVPWFTPAGMAAKQATRDIPIVCARCGDMVELGFVESLARPGTNMTGMSGGGEIDGKCVELMHEMLPSARRIAALANAPDPFSKSFLKFVQLAGDSAGTTIDRILIHDPNELDAAFAAMDKQRPDAVIVQPSLPTRRVVDLAIAHRLPAASHIREFAEAGGLLAFSTVAADYYRRTAVLVDKILKGAKPAELPAEEATNFNLLINLKTAKAIGLTVPLSLLERADEVIE